jgi:uncharacterized alkaline shock family protein YloU
MITRPVCRLGWNRRLVRTFEWLTLCPNCGPLPQIAHLRATKSGVYHLAGMAQAPEDPPSVAPSTLARAREIGRIEVYPAAVAALAAHAASECYGVMGMAGRGLRAGVAELLRRDLHRGVEVRELEGGLEIDVFVIVNYGMRITEVAHNLQSAVRFEVERSTGVSVTGVNVFVQGVQEDRSSR